MGQGGRSVPRRQFGVGSFFEEDGSGIGDSEIKRTLRLLDCDTLHRRCVNHGRADIAVAKQLLDGAYVEIVLEKVACIAGNNR